MAEYYSSAGILNNAYDSARKAIRTASAAAGASNGNPAFSDAGTATTLNVLPTPCALTNIQGTNANAAVRYLQVHNTATVPGGGAVPLRWWLVPAGTAAQPAVKEVSSGDLGNQVYCSSGLAWAWSTTAATYTAATASDHTTAGNYVT